MEGGTTTYCRLHGEHKAGRYFKQDFIFIMTFFFFLIFEIRQLSTNPQLLEIQNTRRAGKQLTVTERLHKQTHPRPFPYSLMNNRYAFCSEGQIHLLLFILFLEAGNFSAPSFCRFQESGGLALRSHTLDLSLLRSSGAFRAPKREKFRNTPSPPKLEN